jgi:hypothetical protein
LKAASRKTLTAALTLGAAVFAWPVQVLASCPRPPYFYQSNTGEQLVSIAQKQVADAPAIFKGRLVGVQYLGTDGEGYTSFLMKYRVSEWKKGKGTRYARILKVEWCDGGCPVKESIAEYRANSKEQLFMALPLNFSPDSRHEMRLAQKVGKRADGGDLPCGGNPIIQPLVQESAPEHYREYLFRITLAAELEKLPSHQPNP